MKDTNEPCPVCHGVGEYSVSFYKTAPCPLCCQHGRYFIPDTPEKSEITCAYCGWEVRNEPWGVIGQHDTDWSYEMIVPYDIHGIVNMEVFRKVIVPAGEQPPPNARAMSRIVP